MSILKDTTIKGDLDVSGAIIENGTKIDEIFGTKITISDGKVILTDSHGNQLGSVSLPS